MDLQRNVPAYVSPRDLSRFSPFHLGPMLVDPPTRKISRRGREVILEPRVMQVLVALSLQPGEVLSRDDLIALCWDGVIVGDNAISRVVFHLRQALADVAGDAVQLETITKVGFRIVIVDGVTAPSYDLGQLHSQGTIKRRTVIIGGGLIAAAAGIGAWSVMRHPSIDPRAIKLAEEADLLMKSGLPGTTRQATRNLERAVEIAPNYADGWGYLALMYRHALHGFSEGEQANFPRMVNSAAGRALAIDPDQPDAKLALALKRPFLGRWADAERDLRNVVRDHPDHWYAQGQLGLLLMDVGRANEAVPHRKRTVAIDAKIPVAWSFLALAHLMADQIHEADAALDKAFSIWPNHPALWFARYRVLIETDRPAEAAAFAMNPRAKPDGFPLHLVSLMREVAELLENPVVSAQERLVLGIVAKMAVPDTAETFAPILALLGRNDLALEAAKAYLRGGRVGPHLWPAPGAFAVRMSALLFYPSMLALRHKPEYLELLRACGLEAFWRKSGSQPDFRRS